MNRLRFVICLLLTPLLLSGCGLIAGSKEAPRIFAPAPQIQTDPGWPTARWSLAIAHAAETPHQDSQRIAVSPVPGELQVYRAALWARTPAEMVELVVLRTLEDSGKLPAVARQASGIAADYRLLLDIRDFRADYAGQAVPAAVIEVNAKLLRLEDQAIIGSHTFRQAQPASGTDITQVSDAFAQALGRLGHDLAGWTLQAGQADQRQARALP